MSPLSAGSMQVTAILRKYMKQSGRTQEDLAEALDVSVGSINKFLNGSIKDEASNARYLKDICLELGQSPDDVQREAAYIATYGLESGKYCISVGDTLTLWYSRVGDGAKPITSENIDLIFDADGTAEFPADLERLTANTRKELARGTLTFPNNNVMTIVGGETSAWRGRDEAFYVKLEFCPSEYAYLYTLRRTDAGKRLLKKYIDTWSPDVVFESATGQGFGVNVAVVCADDKVILGRRSTAVGVRRGQLDIGVVEGLSGDLDVAPTGSKARQRFEPSVPALRALREELGITDDKVTTLRFLNLGFDLEYAQWNLICLCQTSLTAAQVKNRHKTVASQGAEYSELYAIDCASPRSVFEFIAQEKAPFWSCGLACVFYTMVNLHGVSAVETALEGIVLPKPSMFLWD